MLSDQEFWLLIDEKSWRHLGRLSRLADGFLNCTIVIGSQSLDWILEGGLRNLGSPWPLPGWLILDLVAHQDVRWVAAFFSSQVGALPHDSRRGSLCKSVKALHMIVGSWSRKSGHAVMVQLVCLESVLSSEVAFARGTLGSL